MELSERVKGWLAEETEAHMRGWDFSHIDGRCVMEDALPWDYGAIVRAYLRPDSRLLDIDTGGGEFLLSLGHPAALTTATEAWPPNVALCRERLGRLGVDVRACAGDGPLPFEDAAFDLVIDRHGSFCLAEVCRVLKPGGVFVTQQVGEQNDRALIELLLPGTPVAFPGMNLACQRAKLKAAGLTVLRGEEHFGPIRFYDVGALVWFARVIAWEFPGFSVERCLPQLYRAQELIDQNGCVEGRAHRYLLAAQRPGAEEKG